MALSMTSPIRAADILEIEMFKDLKVFCLRGVGGDDLVIKNDAITASNIKNSALAVKAIDRTAKMKILTASELQELKDYVKYYLEIDAYYESLGFTTRFQEQKQAVKDLQESLGFTGCTFAKMDMQRLHHLEQAITKRAEGNKDVMRLIVTTLKADGGLEQMGQVVAGDMFTNNTDRFRPVDGQKTFTYGPFTVNLKTLVNPGNAMIVATQGGYKASMLDYADPNNAFADFNAPLGPVEQRINKNWYGRTLVDKKARRKFAEEIADDLEAMLHPKKSFFSLKAKLGRDAAKRLDAGMVQGARLIKTQLEAKFSPNRWTPGIKERYDLICQVRP